MSSYCLLGLPNELLNAIGDLCQVRELKALSEVCSALRSIALPRLYETANFSHHRHVGNGSQPLSLFLHTVCYVPGRALFVKNIQFTGDSRGSGWQGLAPLDPRALASIQEIVLRSHFPLAPSLLQVLGSGGSRAIDAAIALLLIILPNLKSLQLGARFHPSFESLVVKFVPAMLQHLLDRRGAHLPGPLQSLQEVEYLTDREETWSEDMNPPFKEVLWLFYLSQIISITTRMRERNASFTWPQSTPQCSKLQSIHLHASCIRIETLATLLLATPRLKRLEYHHQCNYKAPWTAEDCKLVDCSKLGKALYPLFTSLEELTLSIEFYSYDQSDPQDGNNTDLGIRGLLGSMTGFGKLRYLKAPLVMLLGWDPLPSSVLEYSIPRGLQIFCCSNDMCKWHVFEWEDEDVLRQMLPLIQTRSESLQKVTLGAKFGRWLWWPKVRESVKAACEEAGIVYDTIEDPYDDWGS